MALTCLMTWQGDKARWRKMYKGRLHYVACSTLGCPPTKEGSAAAANAWWRARLVELQAAEVAGHPHAARLGELSRRRAWAEAEGEGVEARNLASEIRRVEAGGEPVDPDAFLREAYRAQFGEEPPADPERLRDLYATEARWRGRLERWDPAPPQRAVGALVDRYLAGEKARVDAGQLSAPAFANLRRSLLAFRDWTGASSPIELVDAARWESWWMHLLDSGGSVETRRKALNHSRAFVGWAAGLGLLAVPANLHSRRYRFGGGARAVPTLDSAEIRKLVEAAPGQLRLHLLLMINCGMTQQDVSDLHPAEVDWDLGRVRRKRSKTSDHAAVPVVEYQLWAPTLDLLRRHGHREGVRALLTESGRPWVRDEIKPDGTRHRVDAVRSNYAHLMRRLGVKHQLKLLRKTSASLLETHETFGRYASLFLGHSPRTIADRHYIRPSQALFDSAILWLGGRYGLA